MPNILDELENMVRDEGIADSSEAFPLRLNQLKVVKCREMRGHMTCQECPVFDFCELVKAVMRSNRGLDNPNE